MISYGKTKNNELGYMSLVNRGYDSKKDGEWKEYYDDGKLRAKGTYSSGIKNNDWKYFNKIGDTLPNDELHKEPK